MEIEASKFLKLGYTSVGVFVSWDCDNAKKKIVFKQLWQHATKDDSWSRFFKETDNGIAILTGEVNDLYVIDCDIPKQRDIELGILDGVETFKSLVEKHGGLPEDVPIQRSASGGLHYFFSLSKSAIFLSNLFSIFFSFSGDKFFGVDTFFSGVGTGSVGGIDVFIG